jgi:uncharacterized protein (DUF885 family)
MPRRQRNDEADDLSILTTAASSVLDQVAAALDQVTLPVRTSSVAVWLYDGGEAYYQEAVR